MASHVASGQAVTLFIDQGRAGETDALSKHPDDCKSCLGDAREVILQND